MNRYINTVIVGPLTTRGRDYPTRVRCQYQRKQGQVVLDQIRTVDRSRLMGKPGRISNKTRATVISVLTEMFDP